MLSTPEGRAWGILMTAFILFCILAVTAPFSIHWHLANATRTPETALKPIEAAVRIRTPQNNEFLAVTQDRVDIVEGTVIATDEYSRGFVRLFENSTLTLYNDTEIVLSRVRTPRYKSSPRPNEITIQILKGRVAIGAAAPAPPDERVLRLTVQTPHAQVLLEEGGYSVLVSETETQVTARLGKATIVTAYDSQSWRSGRCRVGNDGQIDGPLPPEQNLIVNGSFDAILGSGWLEPIRIRQDPDDPLGEVEIVATNGKTMLSFRRLGARTHGEQSTVQYVDQDVRDFASLKFSSEIRVNYQSLAGGGYESTEFPIMIELKYKDALGGSRSRYWGFYYLDPGAGPEWKTMVNGIKVVQGEWYLFESTNLMQATSEWVPVYIESIRIYASGWDFDSAITGISLQVKE